MAWHIAIYTGLVHAALASLLLLALGAAAVLLTGQPARRIRIIELTLAGLLVLPLVALVPGVPRWSILPATFGPLKNGTGSEWIGGSSAKNSGREVPASPIRESEPVFVAEAAPAPETIAMADEQIAPQNEEPQLAIEAADEPKQEPAPMPASRPLKNGTGSEWIGGRPAKNSGPEVPVPIFQLGDTASPAASNAQATWRPAWWPELWPELPSDFRFWIVVAYLTGVAAMMLWSLVGLLAVRRLLRSSRPADDACRAVLREIAGPASDRVALLVSPRANQPYALAWRPTTIVLPEKMALGDDPQKLRWTLAHEWSHVERWDIWSWTASGVVRWFYFYQPLLWWLRRQLQLCQDFVADARAARLGAMPEDYAEFLTVVSSSFSHPPLAAGLGIGGRTSDLHRRVVMLVENHAPLESASPRKWNLVVLPIAVLVVALLACAQKDQPVSAAAEPEPPAEAKAAAEKAVVAAQKAAAEKAVVAAQAKTAAAKADAAAEKADAEREVPAAKAIAFVLKAAGPRKIAPGDVLIIDVVPNLETATEGQVRVLLRPNLTVVVDPDGMLSLGSHYGGFKIQGKALDEAEKQIQAIIARGLMDDAAFRKVEGEKVSANVATMVHELNVRVSYAGATQSSNAIKSLPRGTFQSYPPYNNASSPQPVAPAATVPKSLAPGQTRKAPSRAGRGAAQAAPERELIQPLDTIEIMATKGVDPKVAGVYLVEPDGDIRLPESYGRVQVKGLDVTEASKAIRGRIQKKLSLPLLQVTKRGRAIFPPGKAPGEGATPLGVYRIRIGDQVTICELPQVTDQAPDYEVQPDGSIDTRFGTFDVAGLTLAEADKAIPEQKRKQQKIKGRADDFHVTPDYVTLGGWKEELEEAIEGPPGMGGGMF